MITCSMYVMRKTLNWRVEGIPSLPSTSTIGLWTVKLLVHLLRTSLKGPHIWLKIHEDPIPLTPMSVYTHQRNASSNAAKCSPRKPMYLSYNSSFCGVCQVNSQLRSTTGNPSQKLHSRLNSTTTIRNIFPGISIHDLST